MEPFLEEVERETPGEIVYETVNAAAAEARGQTEKLDLSGVMARGKVA